MSYEVVFGPKAAEAYESLPLSLLDAFDAQIDRLAADPPAVAVPGKFPFPPNRMVFHFELTDFDDQIWYFAVHFRYDVNEIVIHVIALTVQHSDSTRAAFSASLVRGAVALVQGTPQVPARDAAVRFPRAPRSSSTGPRPAPSAN